MRLNVILQVLKNMGPRYVVFRSWYEMKRRSGWLKRNFPTQPPQRNFISLQQWQYNRAPFFFEKKENLSFAQRPEDQLKVQFETYRAGTIRYFNAANYAVGTDYDWLTNPSNQFRYDASKHWTEIPDFSQEAGDIKYVWEKSRFSFLYTLIRYDYHFGEDQSELVFQEIDSWITANPVNQGPNYRCSQEISLRVLNWAFALYYYADAPALTEARWQRIQHAIYWQLRHVYQNIHFSRISVRNNHAITETLMLYLAGLLFPFFPEAGKWKQQGKQWFEQEIAYQVYPDGSYLQFSHNYHRVVVQLMTWAFCLGEIHQEKFKPETYDRAQRTLAFLYQNQDAATGRLPNYGGNDGALFFPWNTCEYRDYRPQLNALYYFFNRTHLYEPGPWREDVDWIKTSLSGPGLPFELDRPAVASFPEGGFYLIRTKSSLTALRCASFRNRPAQADNLHLDLWVQGKNLLRDAGSYRYNTSPEWMRYFNGTQSHNTVMLGDHDQMLKGPRFIWLHWSEALEARLEEHGDHYEFSGKVRAFKQVHKNIIHHRLVKQDKNRFLWEVEDTVEHATGLPIHQRWNLHPDFFRDGFQIEATDQDGQPIEPKQETGWYSPLYGIKEEAQVLCFTTTGHSIRTKITNDEYSTDPPELSRKR